MKNSVVIPSHESCKTMKLKIPRSYDYFTVHETRKKKFTIIRALHRTCLQFFFCEKKNPIKVLPFQPFCGLSVNIPMHCREMPVKWGFLDISHFSISQRYAIFRQINSKRHCHNDFQFNTLVFKPLEANRSKSAREPRSQCLRAFIPGEEQNKCAH